MSAAATLSPRLDKLNTQLKLFNTTPEDHTLETEHISEPWNLSLCLRPKLKGGLFIREQNQALKGA